MSMRRALTVVLTFAALSGAATLPVASASPKPGDVCDGTGPIVSADGTVSCDIQAGTWMSTNPKLGSLGQPCSGFVGAVTMGGYGESDIVTCKQTSNGPVWQHWSRSGN
jgi:hypothetical protein